MARRLVLRLAALGGAVAGLPTATCSWFKPASKAGGEPKVYESCEVIGDGLSGELWKQRHRNVRILEPDHAGIQLLMTVVRDGKTEQRTYRHAVQRLLGITIEEALAELPMEEAEVTTSQGHKYAGFKRGNENKLLALTVATDDGGSMTGVLSRLLPGIETGRIDVQGESRKVIEVDFPADIAAHRQILLLDAVVAGGRSIMSSLDALEAAGVDQDDISVVCLTIAPETVHTITVRYPNVRVVSASLESGRDKQGFLVPGIGKFEERYGAADA